MHELSICQALLVQLTAIATARGASAVTRIVVEIGPLSGVEPGLLVRAFDVARAGTCAAEATLTIDATTIKISCTGCGAESLVAPNRLLCAACGSFRTRIVAGDELRLRRVELRVPDLRTVSAA